MHESDGIRDTYLPLQANLAPSQLFLVSSVSQRTTRCVRLLSEGRWTLKGGQVDHGKQPYSPVQDFGVG